MKIIRLSSSGERIAGISFSVITIIALGFLLFVLRSNMTVLLLCGLLAVILSGALIFYMVSILKSAVIPHPETKTLEVKGFPSYTLDLSKAVLLQTLPRKSSHITTRVMYFTDEEENILAAVPTFFIQKQGIWADPTAKEIARELGIEFQQNVPDWEFDKELRLAHEKEVAEQEKLEQQERRAKRKAYRVAKIRQRMKENK